MLPLLGCTATPRAAGTNDAETTKFSAVDEPRPLPDSASRNLRGKDGSPSTAGSLCENSSSSCSSLLRANRLLNDGKVSEAIVLAESVAPIGEEERALQVILAARGRLESGELAYGAGGTRARGSVALLNEVLSRSGLSENVRREASIHRARALLALGEGERALPELERLVSARGEDSELQAALGIAYLAVGQVSRSLGPLEKAVRLDPNEAERHIVLGTAQMLTGDLERAERSFRGAIRLDGDSARAHGDLGSVLLLRGKPRSGRQHLQRAALLEPGKATYASNLSYAELVLDQPQSAKEQAERAIHLDPKLASGWLNLGLAMVALGDLVGARASFRKAEELDPSDPRPANNLSDLDELETEGTSK